MVNWMQPPHPEYDDDDSDDDDSTPYVCPLCGSDDLNLMFWLEQNEGDYPSARRLQCDSCGHEFDVDFGY